MIRSMFMAMLLCCLAVPAPARSSEPRTRANRTAEDAAHERANDSSTGSETPDPQQAPRSDLRRSRLTQDVDRAIQKGVKVLISRQNPDGSWSIKGEQTDTEGGATALVALALLAAGESHQSEPLIRATRFLKSAKPQRVQHATYSMALRAAFFSQLPAGVANRELRQDLIWLQQAMISDGSMRGLYGYGMPARGSRQGWADFSNSQYGVLGVWYGAMAGVEVPLAYWKRVDNAWRQAQNDDGGWSYRPGMQRSYASMTAAGAATLFITNDYLHAGQEQNLLKPSSNKSLDAAMAWLGEHFAVDHNPGIDTKLNDAKPTNLEDELLDQLLPIVKPRTTWVHYMLFSYERVGEASGLTRFGRRKWFDEGAAFLVRTQKYDGSWEGSLGLEIDTAYALLFLARGRAPVIVQKLQYGERWNNRSRDMASFVTFMRRATERHVNWQIVSIDSTPGELREAPILYMAGDRPVKLSSEQQARLRNYIEQGGLLLCVNEGPQNAFARSIESLAVDLFPNYSFRDLPQDHPIYTANFDPAGWNEPIRAMSNGIRELIVLVPRGDASWKWQSAGGAYDVKRTAYAPLANLVLYVTDKSNPRYKGEDPWVELNDGVKPNRSAHVARISYSGNWDPEPGGWRRLANIMHNFDQCRVQVSAVSPQQLGPQYHMAHLTGTQSIELTAAQLHSIKQYVDKGGILMIDAAGGSPEVALLMEAILKALYPDGTLAPLELDHPIYRAERFGGQTIEEVTYRRSLDRPQTRLPRLKGFTVNDKLVAIISNEDLSAALVAYQTSGPIGYTPESATDLMRNIILWSASKNR